MIFTQFTNDVSEKNKYKFVYSKGNIVWFYQENSRQLVQIGLDFCIECNKLSNLSILTTN